MERAKQRFPSVPVHWRCGDILDIACDVGDFDAVISTATLHHLSDTRAALACLGDLVRPGGTIALVTFARPGLRHLPWELATIVIRGVTIRLRGKWEHSAPTVWPPRYSIAELRRHVRAELPGAQVSLLLLGRVFIQRRAPR